MNKHDFTILCLTDPTKAREHTYDVGLKLLVQRPEMFYHLLCGGLIDQPAVSRDFVEKEWHNTVFSHIQAGNNAEAIRTFRNEVSSGLKEAKDAVFYIAGFDERLDSNVQCRLLCKNLRAVWNASGRVAPPRQ